MTRSFPMMLPSLLVFAACGPGYDLHERDSELQISPSLVDFGLLTVGDRETDQVHVDLSYGADAKVFNVWFSGEHAGAFSFDGPSLPTKVVRDETLLLDVSYNPAADGWHSATMHISHGAKGGDEHDTEITIRGHALRPDLIVVPWSVDFGPVDVGGQGVQQIAVRNVGLLDVTLDAPSFTDPARFGTETTFPIDVEAGDERVVRLTFDPTDTARAEAEMAFEVGDVSVGTVQLRGNDCLLGNPSAYDTDNDGYTSCSDDCDDNDSSIHPGATEVWDDADQDCDGIVDEGTDGYDDDGDGFCEGPGACSDGTVPGDCNDGAPGMNPGANEILDNGIDDDCDGVVDLGTTDGDGDGYSEDGGDCDDNAASVHPGAPELPDWIDNDCDNTVDEGTPLYDDDGDGWCDDPLACSDGATPGDCDDDASDQDGNLVPDGLLTFPGANELPDWRDNNCNGQVDEGTVNADDDGDGFTEVGGDCNDADPNQNPAMGCAP